MTRLTRRSAAIRGSTDGGGACLSARRLTLTAALDRARSAWAGAWVRGRQAFHRDRRSPAASQRTSMSSRRMRLCGLVVAGALGSGSAGVGPALAAWGPPVTVTPIVSGRPLDLSAAQNTAGAAVAVWIDETGGAAQASFRPAGSVAWSAATTLPGVARAGSDRVYLNSIFDVNHADDGSVVVAVSLSQNGQHAVVVWRYAPADGAWAPPVVMASGVDPSATAVAIDRDGGVTAAWQGNGINAARLAPDAASATLTRRAVPNLTDVYARQRFAIAPDGAVTAVVFGSSRQDRTGLLGYRLAASDATWKGPASIIPPSRTSLAETVDLVVNGAGGALVVWQKRADVTNHRPRSSSTRYSIFARRMTPAGRWGAARRLSSSPGSASKYASIGPVLSESGLAAVVYFETTTKKLLAVVSNGASWKPPHLVTRNAAAAWGYDTASHAGVTADDQIVVVWAKPGAGTSLFGAGARSSVRSRTGLWREPQRLTGLPASIEPVPRLGLGYLFGRQLDRDSAGRLVLPWRVAPRCRPNGQRCDTHTQPLYASTFLPD